MKRFFLLILFSALLLANQYDYLLFSNNFQDVKRGLQLGANVNARLRGSTPLYDAARKNNAQAVYLLINYHANVNAICHGETALHKVVQFNNIRLTEALLKAGARVNVKDSIRGNTPLQYAAMKNNIDILRLLIKAGADMNIPNNSGDTPARYILSRILIPALRVDNSHLAIASSAFTLSSGAAGVSATNLTNSFITITNVALYINGELITEMPINKTLAPRSSSGIASLNIPRDAYRSVSISSSGVMNIQYGFAIQYNINNSQQTLYKTSKTTTRAW
ncbi:ankyrin repeat-containing protein [Helicobacter mustelae]|uniref:ankyrin repeat domain-containing protein n=1 Tax=Helicobacter mustelae TaxID=217 RepID=UPI000E012DC6|nr:ankyrin repeat domain-containing protein [Helicobacter mustelae]STP12352.1 ankyrin repeat-containing protein [Helicobacter mustelae]